MKQALCVTDGADFLRINVECEAPSKNLTIPDSKLYLHLKLFVNNTVLSNSDYDSFPESVAQKALNAPLWSSLGYDISLFVENSLSFCLSCQVFESVRTDLVEPYDVLSQVDIELHYLTEKEKVSLDNISRGFNYLFQSWLMSMDSVFPLVFSYYGRALFRANYRWIKKCIVEVSDPEFLQLMGITAQKPIQDLLMLNLRKLNNTITNEYNWLSVLRRFSKDSRVRARATVASTQEITKSSLLKNTIYKVQVW